MTIAERIERDERIARTIHDDELDALRERYASTERATNDWPPVTVSAWVVRASAAQLPAKEYGR